MGLLLSSSTCLWIFTGLQLPLVSECKLDSLNPTIQFLKGRRYTLLTRLHFVLLVHSIDILIESLYLAAPSQFKFIFISCIYVVVGRNRKLFDFLGVITVNLNLTTTSLL